MFYILISVVGYIAAMGIG